MQRFVVFFLLLSATVLFGACGNDDGITAPPADDDQDSATSSTTTASTTTSSTTTTTTEVPPLECPLDGVLTVVDAAIAGARLAPGDEWSTDTSENHFAERTASGDEFVARLGLDCGLTASQTIGDDHRLVIAAWTGSRMAWVVQTTETPSTPYAQEATLAVSIGAPRGEFVDGDERAVWAGTLDGETFIIGHVDYGLGPAAKDWVAGPRGPFDDEINLDSERHAIAALGEAGMRNISIAQLPERGSEEGYVAFISPTGQIMVADIAPTGWFDPNLPRYFTGATRLETIAGAEVRITDPAAGDNLGFTNGAEYGWACDNFVWLFEPPFNGSADEMIASVEAVIETEECRSI